MNSRSSKSDTPASLPECITVGRVRKPHGVRGEVVVDVLSDVQGRFAAGSVVEVVLSSGERNRMQIDSARIRQGGAIVRFVGCESRDQAEGLRRAAVEIDRSQVPPAPEGAFYYFELIGCACVDEHEGELGRVARVLEDGGGLILEISSESRNLLVPFVDAYLKKVDIAARRIELTMPKGLIETCTSGS